MAHTLRPQAIFPITTRQLSVLRVADVTPGMRRVTLGGAGLNAHVAANGQPVAAFRSDGFDDEFKLVLPDPVTGEFVVPTQADGTLNWPEGSFSDTRTYTVRRWNAQAGELDLDVVKHGSGPATTWAYSCRPGDTIHIAGPKMSNGHPDVGWLLIGGDETALPAIGRWLEELPAGTRAQVFIEVARPEDIQELRTDGDVTLTWLSRDGAPAGTTTLLFDALRAAPWESDDVFAWVAGETLTLTPIRRWLRNDKGLPRERVEVAGYWRRAGAAADGAGEIEPPQENAAETLHELLEIVPGVAVRVASTLGVIEAIGAAPLTGEGIAEKTDAAAPALVRLLRYLGELDIVTADAAGRWSLTPLGAELDNDDYRERLDLRSASGRSTLGITGLLEAVRTGTSAYTTTFGAPFADIVAAEDYAAASRLHTTFAMWCAAPLAESAMLSSLREVRITGPGAGDIAQTLVARHPAARVRLLVPPSQGPAARSLPFVDAARVEIERGGVLDRRTHLAEAYLLVSVLAELPDADAVHVLAEASASTTDGSVLVFEEALVAELAGEHDYEHDLELLAVHGGALRTTEQIDALAREAGLRRDAREPIGWGNALLHYVRD
ncbi:siderophore-interacting protein [Microbacterium protaetiae]|uniref:Siderophore-interacting protein n=1 Tax=Microbacterium protaetiae TaxID=2509458 RepID=A0A4P6EEG4_9MICO|nr:siderophore-interacting protein [Microbacterium protaetiae]QAY60166.1 siderophore-interacting protein [Microbacterium protaetiae]